MMLAVHTESKSRFHPSALSRIVLETARAAIGVPRVMPVLAGSRVIGLMRGSADGATFTPITHRQWCGFTGYADLDTHAQQGYQNKSFFSKDFSSVAGQQWVDMWCTPGIPASGTYTGTVNVPRAYDNTSPGGLYINGTTPGAGQTRHFSSWSIAQSSASVSNMVFMLYDRVLSYDQTLISNTLATMTTTPAAARYIASGQDGLLLCITGQTSTALGATAATVSNLTVTDQLGNTGVQFVGNIGMTLSWYTSAPSSPATGGQDIVCPRDLVNGSTFSPFVAMPAGVAGIRKVESLTSSATNTGAACMVLLHPIGMMWGPLNGNVSSDIARATFALERVYDDACVSMLAQCTNHSGTLLGYTRIVHG